MKKNKNVLFGMSGGPTPVINNSLRGVIETCRSYPSEFGKIYAGWHGIEGVLQEELIDISAQPQKKLIYWLQLLPQELLAHVAISSRKIVRKILSELSRC